MSSSLPNLYSAFELDRSDGSEEIGLVLAARDLRLEQMGIGDKDPRRVQTTLAFSVLSDSARRMLYDEKLDEGVPLSWAQIEHLANFGTIPAAEAPQMPQPPHQPPRADAGYNYGMPSGAPPQMQPQNWQQPQPQPFQQAPHQAPHQAQPFQQAYQQPQGFQTGFPSGFQQQVPASYQHTSAMGSYSQEMRDRPTASTRLMMALMDFVFATILGGLGAGLLFAASDFLGWVVMTIIMVLYLVGFESVTGATPAKHMLGYKVRNVETKKKLTPGESAARNWFKMVNMLPGPGTLVSLIAMGIYGSSINPDNQLRGNHDRHVDAEVVKKTAF